MRYAVHDRKARIAEPLDGPTHVGLGRLAAELGITLVVGSVAEHCPAADGGDPTQAYNTTLVFGPDGARLASYRKVHLFDVDLRAAGGVTFSESRTTARGTRPVVVGTPAGRLGLSICFDLRFPEHFRMLTDNGAEIMMVPAAFTLMTGMDHWHTLLRARAIETQSWVMAPAQWGAHDDGGLRRSYGHSLIVDPWGTVVAECGAGEGICLAEIDLERVAEIRQRIPMNANRQL
ncbi:MAG: carbon-nitrogen hydrolase family protein [Myxococcota bacterium]|nr:carbon-nitrogen hydrolase family protein [Myxococcota bacterium]